MSSAAPAFLIFARRGNCPRRARAAARRMQKIGQSRGGASRYEITARRLSIMKPRRGGILQKTGRSRGGALVSAVINIVQRVVAETVNTARAGSVQSAGLRLQKTGQSRGGASRHETAARRDP